MANTKVLSSARKLSKTQILMIMGLLAIVGIVFVLFTRAGSAFQDYASIPLGWKLDASTNPSQTGSTDLMQGVWRVCVDGIKNTGTTDTARVRLSAGSVANPTASTADIFVRPGQGTSVCTEPSFKLGDTNPKLTYTISTSKSTVNIGALNLYITEFPPENLRSVNPDQDAVTLQWDPGTIDDFYGNGDDGGYGGGYGLLNPKQALAGGGEFETKYKVYRVTSSGSQLLTTTTDTQFSEFNLPINRTYTYYVTAVDFWGTESDPSETIVAGTTDQVDLYPQDFSINESDDGFDLNWNLPSHQPQPDIFRVYRADGYDCVYCYGGSTTFRLIGKTRNIEFLDYDVSPGQEYYYYVAAVYNDGKPNRFEAHSWVIDVTAPDHLAPDVPTGINVTTRTARTITINWEESFDNSGYVEGYIIYRNGKKVGHVYDFNTSFMDRHLKPATTYRYQIAAFDSSGNKSKKSRVFTATTRALPKK